jgi:ubiquinone/menaquinone biosynthesis C-methylase UbiE
MDKDPIQRFYNKWSEQYDTFATNPIVNRWRKKSIYSMNLNDGDTVLDIGCGTGANIPMLSEEVGESGRVICADISEGGLLKIRENFSEDVKTDIDLVKADGMKLPISELDGLYASFSIGMFPDPLRAIKRWEETLKTETKVCLMNVVKSQNEMNSITNKPIEWFTGMSVPTNFEEKIRLSYSGDALEKLNSDIREVYNYLEENNTVVSQGSHLNGSIKWVSVQM